MYSYPTDKGSYVYDENMVNLFQNADIDKEENCWGHFHYGTVYHC